MTKVGFEPAYAAACERSASRPPRRHFRTLVGRYLLDPVLPMLALLSMSALTIVMLVTVVSAVADMGIQAPASYVSIDPWSYVSLTPADGFFQDQEAYRNSGSPVDAAEESQSWPGVQGNSPSDAPDSLL